MTSSSITKGILDLGNLWPHFQRLVPQLQRVHWLLVTCDQLPMTNSSVTEVHWILVTCDQLPMTNSSVTEVHWILVTCDQLPMTNSSVTEVHWILVTCDQLPMTSSSVTEVHWILVTCDHLLVRYNASMRQRVFYSKTCVKRLLSERPLIGFQD